MAKFQQMNFTQMQERLRMEMVRRIKRHTLTISLLSRQTGYGQPHMSSFVHNRNQLSVEALDRVLAAQKLGVADLLESSREPSNIVEADIPLVSYATALYEPFIRSAAVQTMMQMPRGIIESAMAHPTPKRRGWQRFVVIRVESEEALPMEPLIQASGFVLLDRHCNSLPPHTRDPSQRPNIYAVRHEGRLALRYLDFRSNRLILRPHNMSWPVELIELDPGVTRFDLIAGRVVLVINVT